MMIAEFSLRVVTEQLGTITIPVAMHVGQNHETPEEIGQQLYADVGERCAFLGDLMRDNGLVIKSVRMYMGENPITDELLMINSSPLEQVAEALDTQPMPDAPTIQRCPYSSDACDCMTCAQNNGQIIYSETP